MKSSPKPRSACPIVFGLDLFGDRWTLLIIRDMAFRELSCYGELLNAGESISTNILADRLKKLECGGVITKERDPDHGSKYRYALTEKGLDLIPIMVEMLRFGAKHDPESPISAEFKARLEADPQGVIAEFRAKHSAATSARRSSSGQ